GDADHFHYGSVLAMQAHSLADGVLVRPEALRERLVDDSDTGRIRLVAFVDLASLEDGGVHGGEEAGHDAVGHDVDAIFAARVRKYHFRGIVGAERHVGGERGRTDAWDGLHARLQVAVEVSGASLGVSGESGIEGDE